MKRAFFLDRDGVINKMVSNKRKFDSPKKASEVVLVEGIIEVITWLNKKKVSVIEITNQPDVALGKYDWQTLEDVERRVHYLLNEQNVKIDKIYRCLHHPNSLHPDLNINCDCRKPKSGLFIQSAKELNIDLKNSIFLGDSATDVEAGKTAGCTTILFFHSDDLAKKIKAKKISNPDFIVYSLKEVIPILNFFFIKK